MVMPCSRSARSPSVSRDSRELILEDRLGVEEQPPDEGALAVVHRARGGQPEHVHVPVHSREAGAVIGRGVSHQK